MESEGGSRRVCDDEQESLQLLPFPRPSLCVCVCVCGIASIFCRRPVGAAAVGLPLSVVVRVIQRISVLAYYGRIHSSMIESAYENLQNLDYGTSFTIYTR